MKKLLTLSLLITTYMSARFTAPVKKTQKTQRVQEYAQPSQEEAINLFVCKLMERMIEEDPYFKDATKELEKNKENGDLLSVVHDKLMKFVQQQSESCEITEDMLETALKRIVAEVYKVKRMFNFEDIARNTKDVKQLSSAERAASAAAYYVIRIRQFCKKIDGMLRAIQEQGAQE